MTSPRQPSQAMPDQPDELNKILHRLILHYDAIARGKIPPNKSDFTRTKAAIRAYNARTVLEGRIEEAGGVQLTYGHMMAQTHAGGKWQSMIERRDDLKAQLAKEQP